MKKRILSLVLAAFMATAIFAGCNQNSTSSGTDSTAESTGSVAKGEKTVITVTKWGELSENDVEQTLINEFNKTNDKNIEVKLDVVPGDGYGDRLTTSFSSGEGYDIFLSGEGDFYKWVDKSLSASLNDVIAADKEWKNPMDESIYNMGKINGEQHYIVKDYNPICLWYNKDLFDAKGVSYPTDNWTWDDLFAAAEKIADPANGVFGFNSQKWEYASLTYLESVGAPITDESGKYEDYLNSDAVVAALDKYFGLIDQKISPAASDLDTFGDAGAMMVQGKLAMNINGGWALSSFKDAGINYGTALVPGTHASYLCASGYSIGTRCKNKEAAWEVLKLLTGEEATKLRVENEACLPTISTELESLKGTIGENNQALLNQIDYSVQPLGLRFAAGNTIVAKYGEALERIIYKDGTTKDVLNEAITEINSALAE